MNIKQKLTTAAIAGSLLAATLLPSSAFAANSVTVIGGGAFSITKGKIVSIHNNSVSQSNTTIVGTTVNATSKTGGNSSSFNTGGTSSIMTGPASNTISTLVIGGGNFNTSPCGCVPGLNTILVAGGGDFSTTKAKIVDISSNSVTQDNALIVGTDVTTTSKTGGNSSSFNTGGSSTITTGGADNTVTTTVMGGGNMN